jgi:hypothetical protein
MVSQHERIAGAFLDAAVGFCLGIEEQWSSVFVRQQARLIARGSSIVQPGAVTGNAAHGRQVLHLKDG